jgi:hypothetical protein
MFDEESKQHIAAVVRTSQIILAALAIGVVTFAVVAVFAMSGGRQAPGTTITLLAVAFGGADLVMCLVIPRFVTVINRKKIAAGTWQASQNQGPVPDSDAVKLALTYQVKMIIGAAMLEGGCFLALVAYMTERQSASLAVAAVLLAALLAHFPTLARVGAWIEDQLHCVEDERRYSR